MAVNDPHLVTTTLQDFLEKLSGYRPQPEENLFSTGVIDSMGLVELAFFLEETFQITLEPENLTFENFATVASIGAMFCQDPLPS